MKVMFDSNVWEKIALHDEHTDDPQYEALCKIHEAIETGMIEAYISENIFTLENIQKKERKAKVGSMKAKTTINTKANGEKASMSIAIGPNPADAVAIDDNPHLRKPTEEALRIGFRIVRLPRIGGLTNKDIEPLLYNVEPFDVYFNKATEVGQKIEERGAGMSQLFELVDKYPGKSIMDRIRNAPDEEWKKIAKAIAEGVDGDAVATCIGLGCDYFCTRDEAKGAGGQSVFGQANLAWLKADYGFEVKKPEEIAVLL